VFEIGNSLREARLRQQLDFVDAEQATKIRSKYLRALEEEQFNVLPAETYVKGFLRNYAEFLGLDGQLYVDEFNSRYVTGEDEPPARPRRSSVRPRPGQQIEANVVLLTVAGIAILTAFVIAAWKFGGGGSEPSIPNLGKTPPATKPAVKAKKPKAKKRRLHTVIRAVGGSSVLQVYARSPTGRFIYAGTLEDGHKLDFSRPRLWVNASSPENLTFTLNGVRARFRAQRAPQALIVTAKGVRAAPTGV
jgi:hypothetical protein